MSIIIWIKPVDDTILTISGWFFFFRIGRNIRVRCSLIFGTYSLTTNFRFFFSFVTEPTTHTMQQRWRSQYYLFIRPLLRGTYVSRHRKSCKMSNYRYPLSEYTGRRKWYSLFNSRIGNIECINYGNGSKKNIIKPFSPFLILVRLDFSTFFLDIFLPHSSRVYLS